MTNEGVQFFTLDNGLSLIAIHDPSVHGVYCSVDVQVGSCDEQLDRDRGICHILEHMVWRGTKDYDEDQIIRMISGNGGTSNACTGRHFTSYSGWTRSKHLGDMLAVLDSVVFRPEIDRDLLETEKTVILEEISKLNSDPSNVAYKKAVAGLFPNHNIKYPIGGTEESVSSMKATRIREYMRSYHRPQAMILGMCGNLPSIDEWSDILHERAHGLSRKTRAANAIEIPRDFGDKTPISSEVIDSEEWENISSSIIQRAFPINIEDSSKLERISGSILSDIFGGEEYSLLFTKIRREKGLSYSCGSFSSGTLDVGVLATYAFARRQNVEEIDGIIDDVIDKILHGQFSDDLFKMSKNNILGNTERLMNNPGSALGYYVRTQHDPDESKRILPDEAIKILEGVTKKDVVAVANKILSRPSSRYSIFNIEERSE